MQKLNDYREVYIMGMSEATRLEDNKVVKTVCPVKCMLSQKKARFPCCHRLLFFQVKKPEFSCEMMSEIICK